MIVIVNHLLMWLFSQASSGCHWVESAASGEYYFVSLFKPAIFRDQGHNREVVVVRQASQRNPQSLYLLLDLSSCCSCFPQSFSTKAQQTTSLPIYLFTNLTSSSQCWLQCRPHPLTSCHPTCALVELAKWMQEHVWRGHPSRIVDERLRIGWWEAFFYSYFVKLTQDCPLSSSLPAGFGFIAPPSL